MIKTKTATETRTRKKLKTSYRRRTSRRPILVPRSHEKLLPWKIFSSQTQNQSNPLVFTYIVLEGAKIEFWPLIVRLARERKLRSLGVWERERWGFGRSVKFELNLWFQNWKMWRLLYMFTDLPFVGEKCTLQPFGPKFKFSTP